MTDFGWLDQLGGWDDSLPVCSRDVLNKWWRLLHREAPWSRMALDDAFGRMRRVVAELVNQARDPNDTPRLARLTAAAFDHGSFRRAQGCEAVDVLCEFGILLESLDAALRRAGMPPRMVQDALACLDPELEKAEDAALLGWSQGIPWRKLRRRAPVERLLDELE